MNEALAALLELGQTQLWLGFLVFLRIGTAVALMPGFGEAAVAVRVRLVLALGLTVVVAPTVNLPQTLSIPDASLAISVVLSEMATGAILGLSIRFLTQALLIAGSIAAQATSLAQLFGNALAEGPQPTISLLLYWAGLCLLMSVNAPVHIVTALAATYDLSPIGAGLGSEWMLGWSRQAFAEAFSIAFTLAAPFVLAALLYNVALGVINRAMPQLMVAFVGAPALTAGGLILLAVASPVLLSVWYAAFAPNMGLPRALLP